MKILISLFLIALMSAIISDLIDNKNKKIKQNKNKTYAEIKNNEIIFKDNPEFDLKEITARASLAYALYYYSKKAPNETWTISYFIFTWQYVGGIPGFILAIPITLFMLIFRTIWRND